MSGSILLYSGRRVSSCCKFNAFNLKHSNILGINNRKINNRITSISKSSSFSTKSSNGGDASQVRKSKLREKIILKEQSSKSDYTIPILACLVGVGCAISYSYYEIKKNPLGTLANLYHGSSVEALITWIYQSTVEPFEQVFEPVSDKLIPDWPTDPFYGGEIPVGTPAPPLLILDLERTLIGSTYDAANGWRHVKRPGLDQFIDVLCKYYEVVIFSENDLGMSLELLSVIDPKNQCHKLGATHAELKNGTLIKRLDYMNRDLAKVLLVDDNPNAFQLQPENAIQVKPYVDVHDKNDKTLIDLLPFLLAIVHDDVKDFRQCLDDLGTHDADEIIIEYQMRLARKKEQELSKRNRGLGGLIRKRNEKSFTEDDSFDRPSSILKLVGNEPDVNVTPSTESSIKPLSNISKGPSVKKKGGLFQSFDNYEKEKEENEMRRREKMNEIYNKKIREKMEKENKN